MSKLKNPNSKSIIEENERCLKRGKEKKDKRRNCLNWSQLPPDLIHSVLERLSIPDLQRAKSVCSSWYSASRNCFPKSQIPWLISFPQDNLNRCKLFNPDEKDKIYTSRDLGVGFAKDVCLTTYGYWLLMQDRIFNLYILNLLTGQRISLPPVESQIGETKLERMVGNKFRATRDHIVHGRVYADSVGFKIESPQLWINEEATDYLVIFCLTIDAWSLRSQYAIICKKGDNLWRELPDSSACRNMVYKHQKLYVFRSSAIQIFDFSVELSRKAHVVVDLSLKPIPFFIPEITKLVVTVSGDVLMVTMSVIIISIYKMSSTRNEWERVSSLAGEAILLDLGITVNAKDVEGIRNNSVYFNCFAGNTKDSFIFDLKTEKIERPHQSVCSSLQDSSVRWFLPCFSRKG